MGGSQYEFQCPVAEGTGCSKRTKPRKTPIVEKTLWTRENELPLYEFSAKEERLESWMKDLLKWGVICVHGCPPSDKGLLDFLRMVGSIMQRPYHPPSAQVCCLQATSQTKKVQLTYAVKILAMHMDFSDYFPPCKLVGLLCTELNAPKLDTKTFIVDAFKVLEDLRQDDPEAFHVLSTTPIKRARYRLSVEEECDPLETHMYQRNFVHAAPIVTMDGNKIKRIHINRGKDAGLCLGLEAQDDN